MTDKQQQIHELDIAIRDIVKNNFVKVPSYSKFGGYLCDTDISTTSIAESLYNTGYRKVDENVVVLSKEKYGNLVPSTLAQYQWETIAKQAEEREQLYEKLSQVRKETVKEFAEGIIKMLWNRGRAADGKMFEYGDLTSIDVWELAKQFGVEVE